MLGHQLEDLVGAAVTVLDRVDAGQGRAAHAFRRGGVRGDRAAGAVRLVHERLQLIE